MPVFIVLLCSQEKGTNSTFSENGCRRICGGSCVFENKIWGIKTWWEAASSSFVTLPVEINASKRALVWLSASGITNAYNHDKAEDALRSAAYTYVVAALGSLATLIYYIMIFMGRRE